MKFADRGVLSESKRKMNDELNLLPGALSACERGKDERKFLLRGDLSERVKDELN